MLNRRSFFKKSSIAVGAITLPVLTHGASNGLMDDSYHLNGKTSDPFETIRKQLLVPKGRIYLNTGSLGPSPAPVIDAVIEAMRQLERNPVVENWGEIGKRMEAVRDIVGEFINADGQDIILTRNTTEGLSLIAQSLKLKQGDEILTTTREHGGGEVGFEYVAERDGAIIRRIEIPMPALNSDQIIRSITDGINSRTRVIMLSHVNTITGLKMPFEQISKITKTRDILLICDGAQAPGMIKVDVQKLGVDVYSSSGHKWILGPKETGFFYLSKNIQHNFKSAFTFSGYQSYSKSSGTRNVATIIGLGKALKMHQEIGITLIEDRCKYLQKYCVIKLSQLKNIKILSPSNESLTTGIASIEILSTKNSEVAEALKRKDIIVKVLPGINALRFSCHIFVSESEISRMVNELGKLV